MPPFLDWYQSNDGIYYFGLPISQSFSKNGATWQYFEGGALRLMNGVVAPVPLVNGALKRLGIDRTAIDGSGLPEYDEAMFMTMDDPNPIGSIYAPGRKWIEVSIGMEQMWAYQGSTVITHRSSAPVWRQTSPVRERSISAAKSRKRL